MAPLLFVVGRRKKIKPKYSVRFIESIWMMLQSHEHLQHSTAFNYIAYGVMKVLRKFFSNCSPQVFIWLPSIWVCTWVCMRDLVSASTAAFGCCCQSLAKHICIRICIQIKRKKIPKKKTDKKWKLLLPFSYVVIARRRQKVLTESQVNYAFVHIQRIPINFMFIQQRTRLRVEAFFSPTLSGFE